MDKFVLALLFVLTIQSADCSTAAAGDRSEANLDHQREGDEESVGFSSPGANRPGEDWPRWRGPRGDGTWVGPNVAETWPAHGLKPNWEQSVGGGYAGVTVVGNRVYTLDRQKEPEEVERVLCFSADTGKPLWSHAYPVEYEDLQYGSGPRAAATYSDGRLYTLGSLGDVRCFDAAGGKMLWTRHLVRDFAGRVPMWGYAASPFVFEDLVIVLPGGADGNSVVALDRASGDLVWTSQSDEAGYATPILISSGGQEQLVVWTPSHVRSLDPRTGRLFWSVPYEVTYGVAIATPIFQEGLVFVSGYWEGSKAIRLGQNPSEARLEWEENRYLRGLMSQPLYRDGHVYLLDKRHGLTCFELATGKKLWDDGNQMTPRGRNPQASLVWLNDSDRALVLNSDGDLILARFTPAGYEELARANIIGETWAHPAYAGNRVFARSDTKLVCVKLPVAAQKTE